MRLICRRKSIKTKTGSEIGVVVLMNFVSENEIKKFLEIMNIGIDFKKIKWEIIVVIREQVKIEETLVQIKTIDNKIENIMRDTRHFEVAISMLDVRYNINDHESEDLLKETFRKIRKIYFERIEVEAESLNIEIQEPPGIKLMKHQEIGAKYIIKNLENNNGFLLADDMRLGKTFTALAVIKTLNTKAIVVTTKKTVDKWKDESNMFGVEGIVVNYESLENLIKYVNSSNINKYEFGIIIFDEVHKIKNEDTQTYEKCETLKKIFDKAKVIGMSGTIFQNEPKEMINILNICNINIEPIINTFREFEINLTKGVNITRTSFINSRIYQVVRYLESGGFYLRRNVNDIGNDYSKNIERIVKRLVFSIEEKRQIYEKIREKIINLSYLSSKETKRRISNLSNVIFHMGSPDPSITKNLLEQIGRYKFIKYLERIKDLVNNENHSIIIFSGFVETQKFCIETFEKLGYNISKILGSQSQKDIIKEIKKFQNKESKIAVCSLRAASEGITLSAATMTIFIDLDYNPAVLMQAENRMINIKENMKKRSIVLISDIGYEEAMLLSIARKTRFANLIQRQS